MYIIIHFTLICVLAPWLIGAGYSICSFNFESLIVAGFGIVVFSLPITFLLAVVSLILWRFFDGEINGYASCFFGLVIGVVMGILLDRLLGDGDNYFMVLSGVVGVAVGHVEFVLFNSNNP